MSDATDRLARAQHVGLITSTKRLHFKAPAAVAELLDPDQTSTYLIGLLAYLVINKRYELTLTTIRRGHGDDGPHGHHGGFAVDGWPNDRAQPDGWMPATDPRFQAFLEDCAGAPAIRQIGLGGSADTRANELAAGPTYFPDNNQDHIHLGVTDGTF